MEYSFYLQRMLENDIVSYEEVDPTRVILIPRQYSQEESLFEDDLANLEARFPDLSVALLNKASYKIEISLAEIGQICPRNRQRIDSYDRLKRYLLTKGVDLNISSKKYLLHYICVCCSPFYTKRKEATHKGCVTSIPDVYSDDLNFLCLLRIHV